MFGGISNSKTKILIIMKIMKMRFIGIYVLLIALIISVVSCNPTGKDELLGKGPNSLRFSNLQDPANNFNLVSFDAVKETKTIVTINRDANSPSALQASASVDFAIDPTVIATYNTANSTNFVLLPAAAYSLVGVSGSTFNFAAGEFIKEIQLALDPSSLDLSQSYAIPVVLKNASSGYTLSSASTALIQIIIKNQYDGIYASTGTRYNFSSNASYTGWNSPATAPGGAGTTGTIAPWSFSATMSTRGATTVNCHVGNDPSGFGFFNVTVNSDNTVTVVSTNETGVANLVPLTNTNYTSTYNPSTKTFELYYQYTNTSGTFRILHDILVYQGPQ
jgi:hypothetical protein